MELKGSVAVVTGASAGIGRATAASFAREGARVVVAARREERLNELAQEIGNRGGMAVPVVCDVGDWAQVQALAERTRQEFGRCDVLVNNAGVPGGGWFADMSMKKAEQVTRINYLGVLYGTKAFLPMMLEAGRGHVVNVASLAGRFAVPGSAVYSASKHAVVAFSESLNSTTKPHGILVTAVNPGLVATEGFPHNDAIAKGRKVLRPEDVARVIVRVVAKGIAPERSIPRWLAAMQVFRVLTPRLYRYGMDRAVKRGLRATQVDEGQATTRP